ncbi:UDP-N-acetylmuramate dehydrogenase [Candidatus Giovannonibacteria bacterium]|nr:UDP-N-acetylmuramate dehydrogenase [Candidatus Giovannonibacteria bacterium]
MFNIRENISLKPYTVFKIGGRARFFVEVKNKNELEEALSFASEKKLPIFLLGAGSNILVSDKGFDGLVIRMLDDKIDISADEMTCAAGAMMPRAASESVKAGLAGFEWAVGVPGTVGGSVHGNSGCYDGEIKDNLKEVSVFNIAAKNFRAFQNNECEFDYRESIFKKRPELIILNATFSLNKDSDAKSADLLKKLSQKAGTRIKEQPVGEKSMGSTFKGIPLEGEILEKIREYDSSWKKNHEKSTWVFENRRGFISAGFVIERAGLGGYRIGDAKISEKHKNFIVNCGNASAENVLMLIGVIKERVHRKFGIQLEEEIQYVGFE